MNHRFCVFACVPFNFPTSRSAHGTVIYYEYRELETCLADTCLLSNAGSRRTALTPVTRDNTVAARLYLLAEMNRSSVLCKWTARQDIPPGKVAQAITLLTCLWEVSGSNLDWDISPGKFRYSTLNKVGHYGSLTHRFQFVIH
jgi:hypothetical protein